MTPNDWENPDWNNAQKVHEWKNYITNQVQNMWDSFTDEQKQAIAAQAEDQASCEEWE